MGCDDVKDLVALAAGGEAQENERIAVEAHLAGCADCAAELRELREMRGRLEQMREGEAPAGSIEAIWPRVRDRIALRPELRFPRLDWILRAAAVLVIGVAIGYASARLSAPATAPTTNPSAAAPETSYGTGSAPAPADTGGPRFRPGSMPQVLPNVPLRRSGTKVEGNYYLPRVERILDGDETEF